MNLIELIKYFRLGGTFENFCLSQSLDQESEVIEIYMEKPFAVNNELAFFEIENTDGKVEYISNGVKYFNLLDFYYFLDTIEEYKNDNSLTDAILAEKILNYAIHDA